MNRSAKVLAVPTSPAVPPQAQIGVRGDSRISHRQQLFRSRTPGSYAFLMRRLAHFSLVLLGLFSQSLAGLSQNVTTQQYGNSRSGVQSQETLLTPSNVSTSSFGKLFSFPVSGYVYAQPLYMSGLQMADGTTHNVLFVATEQDYVYAFDADGNNPAQGYLWRDLLLGSNETWGSYNDVHSQNIAPDIGITSTPVIDPSSGTIFVVTKSKTKSGTLQYFQRLHALKLADGTETLNGPTLIQATAPGTAGGGTTISFDPQLGNQRAGLLLAATPNGATPSSVFITWASHGDYGPYHGWVISYSSSDISQQTGVWVDTPNGGRGGIWFAGGALSSDDDGNIFGASGNGTFDANTGGVDYGDTAFSLSIKGSTLGLNTYFTPSDEAKLANDDLDMGMSSMVLLPAQTGPVPHLAVTFDKSGMLYLLNRDSLGGYSGASNTAWQSFNVGHTDRGSASFFNNTLYMAAEGGPLSAWPLNPQTEQFATTPTTTSTATFGCSDCDGSGTTPAISANGTSNAIVWILNNTAHDTGPSILRAYDPANLQNVLYDSSQAANQRDAAGTAVKWTVPVVANGHVYVGGVNTVTVYGELNSYPSVTITATPTSIAPGASSILAVTASNATQVTVSGSDGSSYSLSPTGGTQQVSPSATTTYTATAVGSGSKVTAAATVTVGQPAATVTISANPAAISAGASSVLTVSAANATQVILTGSDGSSYKLSASGGTQSVTPAATTTYTATAAGSTGTVSATATVTVNPNTGGCLPTAPGTIICAPAPGITTGSPVTITAGSIAAQGNIAALRVYIDNVSLLIVNNPSATKSFQLTHTFTVQPGKHHLVIVGYETVGGGAEDASEYFTVNGSTATTVTLGANPASISPGGSATLSVTASNATQVTISGSDGSSYTLPPTGGTQLVSPAATTTYTATAVGTNGKVTASATVTVGQVIPSVKISSSPASISPGGSSTLTITASNATQVTVSGSDGSSYTLSPSGGAQRVSPAATTTYTVTAAGTNSKVTASATVTVVQPAATVTLSASPASIQAGASSVLTVTASNATQVIVTGSDGSSYKLPISGGAQSVTPAATTTYTAMATGSTGTVSATSTVTVTPNNGGCLPSGAGTIVCAPAQGATTGSPVTITAGSIAAKGNIAALRAYIDNVAVLTVYNRSATKSFQFSQTVAVKPGNHHLVIVAYETVGGGAEDASEYFSVK